MSAAQTRIISLKPNPFEGWGAYAAADANRIHMDADGRLVVFHITTPERAAEIIASGPKAHAVRVGHEMRAPAFWVNCVPWVPYSVEQFHPAFENDQDMAVVGCKIDGVAAFNHLKIDSSWPFAQWGVPVEMVEDPWLVTPEEFWHYRSSKEREQISGYIVESLEAGLLSKSSYAAKLVKS